MNEAYQHKTTYPYKTTYKYALYLLWVWGFLLCNLPLVAQSQPNDSGYHIEEVTITAKRLNRQITPSQELKGETLKRLNAHSVADAVRYFSGTQIKDYGGIGGLKTVNVRSMGTHHVGVFYDGVELGNAQNGVIDLGRFSLDNMEAIALYNGQKSTIFQTAKDYATATAIYLTSRKPRLDLQSFRLKTALKGGSFGTINPSVLWEQRISKKISASFHTEMLYSTGKYKFNYAKKNGYDTTETRKNGDIRLWRAETSWFGELPKGEWKAKAYYYNSERGYPGAAVREEPGKFRHQDRQWDRNFFVQAAVRNQLLPRYALMVNAKYANDYLHYESDPNKDVSTMYVNNHYRQQEVYASVAHLINFNEHYALSIAHDYQWNGLHADVLDFVRPERSALYSALAASATWPKVKLQASLLHTYLHDVTHANGKQKDRSVLSPSVVASWQPFTNPYFLMRGFYKRAYRMPTLNDLYYTFIGNANLEPEDATQYNLGFTYQRSFPHHWFSGFEVQADAYYNIVDNKIIAMPTSNQFRWTMLNLGKVEIKGLDVSLQGELTWGKLIFNPRISYTFQRAQDVTDRNSEWYGEQIPYIPRHSATLVVGGQYRQWSWNYSFVYTGERYEAVANIQENYAQPWYTHDCSLSRDFNIKQCQLKATAEINNIFNQQYEVVQCYPMPGTNFFLKLSLEL